MKAAAFDYHRPRDVAEAVGALGSREDAKALAGGCSLAPMLNLRLARPTTVVDVRTIPEMREVSRTRDGVLIGASITHAEIEDGLVPDVTHGLLPAVAGGIAFRAIRNRGTLGGSLAHADPAADWISTMLALDARLVIRGRAGERQAGIEGFMTGAYATNLAEDEIVVAVHVPGLGAGARWGYQKICRKTGEFAKALGVAIHDPERGFARVVCGAVEAPPLVLPETSAALLTKGIAGAREWAGAEVEALLAAHDETSRQLHRVAVDRALAQAGGAR